MSASKIITTARLILWSLFSMAASFGNEKAFSSMSFRPGRVQDQLPIALSLIRNFQNPLEISNSYNNLLVAVADDDNNDMNEGVIVGWAQIRPLGSAQRDSRRFDAPPGTYDLQQDVDDQMWDEFIDDASIEVPTGWASLPWTEEYRRMEAGIAEREARRAALVEQAERERRATEISIWEISSLFVEPVYRSQGIGLELIRRLCDEYQTTGKRLCDLYVATSMPELFHRCGFEQISSKREVPLRLKFNGKKVCMRGKNEIT